MGDNENDYDRIAIKIGEAFAMFVGNAHEPAIGGNTDSITITKDGFIATAIRLQRLQDWVDGLANAHRLYVTPSKSSPHVYDS